MHVAYSQKTTLRYNQSDLCILFQPCVVGVACHPWQLNGSSIFVGPGLGDNIYTDLELDLTDGFLTSKQNLPFFLTQFASPLPGTKLEFDFELDCDGECSLTLAVVSLVDIINCRNIDLLQNRQTFSLFSD